MLIPAVLFIFSFQQSTFIFIPFLCNFHGISIAIVNISAVDFFCQYYSQALGRNDLCSWTLASKEENILDEYNFRETCSTNRVSFSLVMFAM